MYRRVFKQKGSRVYRGRFRIGDDPKVHDVPLHTDKKHVAEAALAKLVREMEEERAGLIAPRPLREAVQKPLLKHLDDYVADLTAQGRSKKHVALAQNRTKRLCQQCGWHALVDVTSDSFNRWRTKQKFAPKTLNEYLTLTSAFFNWLCRHDRFTHNPLSKVSKAETRGRETRVRRALNEEEVTKLLATPGIPGLAYAVALFTGLRRREIQQLEWADVHLDAPRPYLEVRSSTTKNKKSAVLPLVPMLVTRLSAHQRKEQRTKGRVFRRGVPTAKTLRIDLKRLGIAAVDELGRRVDFHALRHTFGTVLSRAGVAPRTAMELMRHSDIRLTTKTYTDSNALPLFDEMAKLYPTGGGSSPSPIASPKTVQNGVNSTNGGASPFVENVSQVPAPTELVQTWPANELAERVGFEPTVPFDTPHFECGAIDHSATSPGAGPVLGKRFERAGRRNVEGTFRKGSRKFRTPQRERFGC